MILNTMLQGKNAKWLPFSEWLQAIGLDENQNKDFRTSLQDAALESARIRSKFEPIADEILKQRAEGVV